MPAGYDLGEAGKRWWKWAWATPQAAGWDAGARYALARRASLEDDLAAIDAFDASSLEWLLSTLEPAHTDNFDSVLRQLGGIIGRLKSLAGGRLAISKEMRELETQLGLNPKALAGLRWKIIAEEQAKTPSAPRPPAGRKAAGTVRRLRAVDPVGAAAG